MTVTPNLSCTVGDTYGFDVVIPNNEDGSIPDVTGGVATWGLYRDAYTRIVYLELSNLPMATRAISGVQYSVVQVDLTEDQTKACPPGDLYHQTKIVLPGETKHIADGIFRMLPTPNP